MHACMIDGSGDSGLEGAYWPCPGEGFLSTSGEPGPAQKAREWSQLPHMYNMPNMLICCSFHADMLPGRPCLQLESPISQIWMQAVDVMIASSWRHEAWKRDVVNNEPVSLRSFCNIS